MKKMHYIAFAAVALFAVMPAYAQPEPNLAAAPMDDIPESREGETIDIPVITDEPQIGNDARFIPALLTYALPAGTDFPATNAELMRIVRFGIKPELHEVAYDLRPLPRAIPEYDEPIIGFVPANRSSLGDRDWRIGDPIVLHPTRIAGVGVTVAFSAR